MMEFLARILGIILAIMLIPLWISIVILGAIFVTAYTVAENIIKTFRADGGKFDE